MLIPEDQLVRPYPSLDYITKDGLNKEFESLINRYMRFIDENRTARDTTSTVLDRLTNKKYSKDGDRKFYMTNADKTAFAVANKGTRPITEGLSIIYVHTDSPALIVKANPLRFAMDPEHTMKDLGVRVDTTPYGGIMPHQWFGHPVQIRGHAVRNHRVRDIRVNGYIPDYAAHVDNRLRAREEYDESFLAEALDVLLGDSSKKDTLKRFGMRSEREFVSAHLYVVPDNKPRNLGGRLISGYGQDDRICVFTGLEAFLEVDKPRYTTVFIGFDGEETEAQGAFSAGGSFFESIIDTVYERLSPQSKSLGSTRSTRSHEQRLREMLGKSLAISADVDVGGGHNELRDEGRIYGVDIYGTAMIGAGPAIKTPRGVVEGFTPSAFVNDRFVTILERNRVPYQTVTTAQKADDAGDARMHAEYLARRGVPTIEFGPSGSSLHAPSELFATGDVFWTKRGYKAFFERER